MATILQHRPNTRARWVAALDRARREGISVRQLTSSGAWIASSASDPHVAYEVSIHRCTCKAAEFGEDPVCKHRAALRIHLGLPLALDLAASDDPRPLAA
ncbi:MAG TPA: hypothetical protein VD767_00975 [Thermomicrobiales bacterium]|nr:hypothetical protein [Thermomicrobiales bacterium]